MDYASPWDGKPTTMYEIKVVCDGITLSYNMRATSMISALTTYSRLYPNATTLSATVATEGGA